MRGGLSHHLLDDLANFSLCQRARGSGTVVGKRQARGRPMIGDDLHTRFLSLAQRRKVRRPSGSWTLSWATPERERAGKRVHDMLVLSHQSGFCTARCG